MEAYRLANGCDVPAASPVWSCGCPCGGLDASCEECGGSGEVSRYRCPGRELGRSRWVARAIQAYQQYDARQTLPVAGGWLDQSAGFVALVSLVDAERGLWEERREAEAERRQKFQDAQRRTQTMRGAR